jgi:hypothetical protein
MSSKTIVFTRDVNLKDRVADKLHHKHFSAMSGTMAAIVGYVLQERYTDRIITEIVVARDHHVFAQAEGDAGADRYIGLIGELMENWERLLEVADLTIEEYAYATLCFANRIGFYGTTDA